jgi:hypothetical protein
MHPWQAVFYIIAIALVALAAFGVGAPRVSLALLGTAFFMLAFALPTIAAI